MLTPSSAVIDIPGDYAGLRGRIDASPDPLYALEHTIKKFFAHEPQRLLSLLTRYYREGANDCDALFNNRLLNTIEILERKTVLESKPLQLRVALTNSCNLSCIMCGAYAARWDMPREAVAEIIALLPSAEHVLWQGGEAFLSPHFGTLFDAAGAFPHLRQRIQTNGLLLTPAWIEKIVTHAVGLDLSVDGLTKETYERVRRGARFEDLIGILEQITRCEEKNGFSVDKSLSLVTMKSNYRDLENIVVFADTYKIKTVILNKLIRWDKKNSEVFENERVDTDPAAITSIKESVRKIYAQACSRGMRIIDNTGLQDSAHTNEQPKALKNKQCEHGLFCLMPWQQLNIEPSGVVYPHCYCVQKAGDVNTERISDIWNNNTMQAYRQAQLHGQSAGICRPSCADGIESYGAII